MGASRRASAVRRRTKELLASAGATREMEKTHPLSRFLHLLRDAPPEVAAAGNALLVARGRLITELHLALERLLTAAEDEWRHPAEILGRPCPDFTALHVESLMRPESGNGDRRRLASVGEKLDRAIRIEASARRRREAA